MFKLLCEKVVLILLLLNLQFCLLVGCAGNLYRFEFVPWPMSSELGSTLAKVILRNYDLKTFSQRMCWHLGVTIVVKLKMRITHRNNARTERKILASSILPCENAIGFFLSPEEILSWKNRFGLRALLPNKLKLYPRGLVVVCWQQRTKVKKFVFDVPTYVSRHTRKVDVPSALQKTRSEK